VSHPLIGVTTYLDRARWGVWDMPAALLPAAYPRLVERAGGIAVMLPPRSAGPSGAADPAGPPDPEALAGPAGEVVARLGALVIAGGADVEPARYGAGRDPRTGPPARERDTWELALIRAALAAGTPLLGICRGMQLLNVALGGTLVQHLDGHAVDEGVVGTHTVTPVPGTRYAAIVPGPASVPTYHHQAIGRTAAPLRESAHADDGTVEAVETTDGTWVLGVQWHPEMGDDPRVMTALVEAATAR
jgi:putative glutamine amidotransferase